MGSKLQAWFAYRIAESIRWNTVSAALLIPGGALAAFLTYWIVWGMAALGLGQLFDFSWTTIHVLAAVFIVLIFVWQFTTGRYFEETYALTRDLMGPQMLGASVQLWYRVNRLKKMDVPACGRVVALLFKSQGRVDIDDVAKKFPEADVVDLVQPLADFDGVVFLQKDSLALTLAPRLVEDFSEWSGAN